MSQIDFTKMAHDQLDEWIQGKIGNDRFYGNHILDLGKLARTMEYAREQYRQEHPPIRYIEINGKKYEEAKLIEFLRAFGL